MNNAPTECPHPINEAIQSEDDITLPPSIQTIEKDSGSKKRKRTSPEDHNILEQEYKRNPKPDKAARLEIVEKVKLTEKEVQIWFQNKRQSSRRKTRPLLPHEIQAYGLGGMPILSSDPITSSSCSDSQPVSPREHSRSDVSTIEPADDTQENESDLQEREQNAVKLEGAVTPASEMERVPSHAPQDDIPVVEELPQANEQESKAVDEASESLPGSQLAQNTLDSSFIAPSSSQAPLDHVPSTNPNPGTPLFNSERVNPKENNAPSSARMRMSLSLDGRAELAKVSPPRAHVPRPSSFDLGVPARRPLQRSQSALPLGYGVSKPSASTRVPRLPTGRSRDARAWEFYADNGARNERNLPVEGHDPSGSAVEAISLLRSNSALKQNQNKRNAAAAKPSDSKNAKKPKLSRASSSLARLQGSHKNESLKPYKRTEPSNLTRSPTGDSDKENWMSGENGSNAGRPIGTTTQWPKQDRRRTLETTANMPGFPSKFGARRNKKKTSNEEPTSIFEDEVSEGKVDPELEKFMNGEISPSKKGDLDCVQGLLSLSQGNWR